MIFNFVYTVERLMKISLKCLQIKCHSSFPVNIDHPHGCSLRESPRSCCAGPHAFFRQKTQALAAEQSFCGPCMTDVLSVFFLLLSIIVCLHGANCPVGMKRKRIGGVPMSGSHNLPPCITINKAITACTTIEVRIMCISLNIT